MLPNEEHIQHMINVDTAITGTYAISHSIQAYSYNNRGVRIIRLILYHNKLHVDEKSDNRQA